MMNKYRLENWAYCIDNSDPFCAPELRRTVLSGNVYGHPNFNDGEFVYTSSVSGWDDDTQTVITKSGSHYLLGNVDAIYEREYPDAMNRLINTLKGE